MLQPISQWILAAVLAIVVVTIAYRLGKLTVGGGVAAIVLGTVVVGTGGWWPGIILVIFFVSSSLLSRSGGVQARGSQRDWVQVLANGWGILLGCMLFALTGWYPWLFFGIGAIAAASADTWSSEIGRTSLSPPRLISNWKVVPPGTSGAISGRGSLAAAAVALLIGLVAAIAVASGSFGTNVMPITVFIGITLAGIGGGVVDSLLGATIQEQRWCDTCDKPTEANPHRCSTITRHVGGIAGFNNDVVNAFCALTGALIGLVSSIL